MSNSPEYFIPDERFTFCIRNFARAKPFSSFLPGIAGLDGIPMWAFYTNRGQCISSFGIESKDGAILEFHAANKAYNLTATRGFRTFLNWKRGEESGFKEFFSSEQAETLMKIRPYEIEIEETDATTGFDIRISYFTVPGQPCAMFARIVTLTNTGRDPAVVEMLDGLPNINCFGMLENFLKNMSRTIEAWAFAENLERNAPFLHIQAMNDDKPDVVKIDRGNFFLHFTEDKGRTRMCLPVINPQAVFGMDTGFRHPEIFADGRTQSSDPLMFVNRTPCAMGISNFTLGSGMSRTVFSIFGNSENLSVLNSMLGRISSPEFVTSSREDNRRIILDIADKCFVKSSSPAFDSYCGQNFIDNVLRGGLPVSIRSAKGEKRDVIHVYSRKHGDPERDYNSFLIMPTFYSQGNGGYRDINQNRRNDVFCNPDVLESNIEYFLSLIQLDGYNPLVVKGVSYRFESSGDNRRFLREKTDNPQMLYGFFRKKFIPYTLIDFLKSRKIRLKMPLEDFVSEILLRSEKNGEASHGEGYWIDHWFYNLDLIDSYESMFPDRIRELMLEMTLTFYDDCYFVQPRSRKYVLYNGTNPSQLNSLVRIFAKDKMIRSRKIDPNKVRTQNGKGVIYRTTLLGKLLILLINKVSSIDASGVGVEMEAGKPSWNDAINGLPAMFGSCISETFEIKRLAESIKRYAGVLRDDDDSICIPVEASKFFNAVSKALEKNLESGEFSNHECWDYASSAREKFREETKFGVKGQEKDVTKNEILLFSELCILKAEKGISKSFNMKTGLYSTYFINIPEKYDIVEFRSADGEKVEKGIVVRKFRQVQLPPFLEGQVHGMKDSDTVEKGALLYKSVRNSQLFDEKLGMYKVNASLEKYPLEIGRIRAFTPGWLENESVFLHMEYKYLLELLRKGLYREFFRDVQNALVPFMDPGTYGRSIFENSSFIASSANPDRSVHGSGFVARLSGSTSEFYNMLLIMALGEKPFRLDGDGKLVFCVSPVLPKWIFTGKKDKGWIFIDGVEKEIEIEEGSFYARCLDGILLAYHNLSGKDVFGPDMITEMVLTGYGKPVKIKRAVAPSPVAEMIRDGKFRRIDFYIK